jgi:uncharacterized protein YciI
MFVVSLTYKVPLDRIDGLLEEHKEWLQAGYAAGVFVASGAKRPRTGGVILARGDRQALDARLSNDPFAIAGAADYEVTEFAATSVAPGLEPLRDQ